MVTLCMDTSSVFLVLGLIKDGEIIGSVQKNCWKRQSEEIFPELIAMMEKAGLQPEDIDAVAVTEGPGSYTGVRIAMTTAKVLCAMRGLPLYTIGTLHLFAGMERARVLLDARGKRSYTAVYDHGKEIEAPHVEENAVLQETNTEENIIGDGRLIGKEDRYPDLVRNFLDLKDHWKKAENVHLVVPEYLKSSEEYLVKK